MKTVVCTHVRKVTHKRVNSNKVGCPKQIEDELSIMREGFLLNHQSKMLVLVSMATDKMIRLVAIYPDVWFMDTKAGKLLKLSIFI
jgi:hypothetical protein